MSIQNWYETDVKIPAGTVYEHNCTAGTNVVQIINRLATGGGNVYADTRSSLRNDYYLVRVDQGKTGTIAHPKQIDTVYLSSDSASDVFVSILEILATSLEMVYNASQIVQMTGAVTVTSMPNVTIGTMPNINIGTMPEVGIKNSISQPSLTIQGSITSIGSMPTTPVVGVTLQPNTPNAWNAAAVGVAGNSAVIDMQNYTHVCTFGNSSAAGDIKVFVSSDNVNFYDSGIKITLAAPGDFFLKIDSFAPRFIRLQSSAAATITATISGKAG